MSKIIKKDNGLFSYYYKHKIKKSFIDILIFSMLTMCYMIYDGRGSDITLILLLSILLFSGVASVFFTYLACAIKVLTNYTMKYDLIACKWHYEVENELASISDDVIINYLRNRYNFVIISISSVLALMIYTKYTLDLEFVFKALVIYIILRTIFLNKKLLKKNKLFIKYREFFPYEEKSLEERKTYLKSKVNFITLISLLSINTVPFEGDGSSILNKIYAGIVIIVYLIISKYLSKIVDNIYKDKDL